MKSVKLRLLSLSLLFCLALSGSLGDLVHTWDFTNETNYAVSDETLIRVDPTLPGKAELILQPDEIIKTEMADYYAASNLNRLVVGPDTSLRLTGTPGSYSLEGIFTSKEFQRPLGGVWQTIDAKAENTIHSGQSLTGEIYPTMAGLVALMHCNFTWRDEISGVNLTPHTAGAVFAPGRLGSGSGNFWRGWAEPLNVLNGAGACTFACWVMMHQDDEWSGIVFSQGTYHIGLRQDPNWSVQWLIWNTSGLQNIYTPALDPDTWYWIVGTWDGSTGEMRTYVNGLLNQTASGPTGNLLVSVPFAVNASTTGGSAAGRRKLDEVAIWERALSAVEIRDLYRGLSAVRFRVRSGSALPLSGAFIGPDGTESSDYFGFAEKLVTTNNFSISDHHMQYRAFLYSDAAQSATPYVRSVTLENSDGSFITDGSWGQFDQGSRDAGIANATDYVGTPYLGIT